MTIDEWAAAVAATRPPLTQEQLAAIRAVFRPVIPQNTNAAPDAPETALARQTA